MASLKKETDRLVESLLVSDREEVYNGKEALVEPKDIIEELVRRKESAIPAMIHLVEKYEKEKERRNYIDYVIEILGRIGSERAIELITRILLAIIANDDDSRTCLTWLRKRGRAAVPSLLRFVEANYEDTIAVGFGAEAMEKIKDGRLVPMLVRLLKYPNPLVVQSALLSLERQGDKSVVSYIIPLKEYKHEHPAEQRQTREFAVRALESLAEKGRAETRDVKSRPKSRTRPDKMVSVRGVDWASIAWAYLERRNGEAIIGYVDDDDSTDIFLHMPRIRDKEGRWVDYIEYLEGRGVSYHRGPDFGCLAIPKNQIRLVKEIEPSTLGTSAHCLVCGTPISRGAFCGEECRALFYVMYGNEILLDHLSKRSKHYEKARLPSDRTIRGMIEAVSADPPRLQDAADDFVKDFGIKPTKVTLRPCELAALYDIMDNSIIVSSTKIVELRQLALWEAINLTLFEHLCECESWKFDKDPRKNMEKQRAETRLFVERMFGRCVKLGLLPPPPKGSFPTE